MLAVWLIRVRWTCETKCYKAKRDVSYAINDQ